MNHFNFIFKNKQWIPFILIFIFSIGVSLALFMQGDDYIWFFSGKDHVLDECLVPNCRYFSNIITSYFNK